MVILDRSGSEAHSLIALRDGLLGVQNTSQQLMRQATNSTDAQLTELHGVPAEDITAYKAALASLNTVLNDPAVEVFLSNVA